MTIKFDENEVKYLMFIHQHDTESQLKVWASQLKKRRDVGLLAHAMCAINWLGWHYYQKGIEKRREDFFSTYRALQGWAYEEDANGNTINLTNDEAAALYMALD